MDTLMNNHWLVSVVIAVIVFIAAYLLWNIACLLLFRAICSGYKMGIGVTGHDNQTIACDPDLGVFPNDPKPPTID